MATGLELGPVQHDCEKDERDGDRNHSDDGLSGHWSPPGFKEANYGATAAERFDLDQTAKRS
jgi:hypothetical protein